MRSAAQWGVDDQRHFALLDVIGDVGASFVDFEDGRDFQPDFAQPGCGAERRHQIKTQTFEPPRE